MGRIDVSRLTPLGKRVLSEQVTTAIREAIITGVYAPGERLIEREVAENLGVSQGPVREAFRKPELEGLIYTKPHQGTYVTTLSDRDIWEILEVRTALERLAAHSVTREHHTADLAPLYIPCRRMEEAARRGDWKAHIEHDLTFHRTLCELSGNSRLVDVWSLLAGQIRMSLAIQVKAATCTLMEIAQSHQMLLNALERRDSTAIEEFFTYNSESVFRPLIEQLRDQSHATDNAARSATPATIMET